MLTTNQILCVSGAILLAIIVSAGSIVTSRSKPVIRNTEEAPNVLDQLAHIPDGIVIDQGNQALEINTSDIICYTGNRTEAVRIQGSGNVGIGTSECSSRLCVHPGTLSLEGPSANIGFNDGTSMITYLTSTTSTTSFPTNGLAMYGYSDGALGTSVKGTQNVLCWNSKGRVGIGSTTPAHTLDVVGNINLSGTLLQNGLPFSLGGSWSSNDKSIYYQGNVGIGTSEPSHALDINGSIHATNLTHMNWNMAAMGHNGGAMNTTPLYWKIAAIKIGDGSSYGQLTIKGSLGGWVIGSSDQMYIDLSFMARGKIGVQGMISSSDYQVASSIMDIQFCNNILNHSYDIFLVVPTDHSYYSFDLDIGSSGHPAHLILYDPSTSTPSTYSPGELTSITKLCMMTQNGKNLGIGTYTPFHPLSIYSDLSKENTTTWPSQLCLSGNDKGTLNLKLGSFDTGSGSFCAIQSTETILEEQPRILSLQPLGGFIGIGTTNPLAPLHVETYDLSSTAITKPWVSFDAASSGKPQLTGPSSFSVRISALFNQFVCSNAGFLVASDLRIKKDIKPLTNCLDTIMKLRPVTYLKKDEMENGDRVQTGFIAQEVEEVYPSAITKRLDFIPSVYEFRECTFVEGGIVLSTGLDIPIGSQVKLMDKSGAVFQLLQSTSTFLCGDMNGIKEDTRIFIYGHQVPDRAMVEKDSLFTIGLGAIQELATENSILKSQIVSYETRLARIEKFLKM